MKHLKFIVAVTVLFAATSCGNRITLKSVGTIDLDTLMVEVKPLVVLTIYQNDMLPDIYSEVYSEVADEYATDANVYNWMIGDDLAGLIGIDQDSYEDIVEQTVNESYSIAWENIQYIVKNNISEADFPMGDIDDEYAGTFIGYYFKTIEDVDARIMLSEPVLLKDEAKYATFSTTNTLAQTNYLIKLTNENDSIYNIEVSEL